MSLAIRPLVGVLVVALMAPIAFANNNNNSAVTSSLNIQAPKKEASRWSGFVNVSRSTSATDFKDGSRKDGMDYMGRAIFKVNDAFVLIGQGGYSQDLKYPESDDFSDTSLNLNRKPFELGKTLLMGYRVGATAPTSKDSAKRQSLISSLSTGLNLSINPARLITGLAIKGSLSVARNIHTYETALDGKVNNQYSSSQMLSVEYEFASGISLSSEFIHKNGWTYQGGMRDAFETTQEVGYQLNPTFAFGLGHTNSGSTLRPNGSDYSTQIYDENSSMFYGSVTVLF